MGDRSICRNSGGIVRAWQRDSRWVGYCNDCGKTVKVEMADVATLRQHAPYRRKCGACNASRPTYNVTIVKRSTGGNYRHPGSRPGTRICRDCVARLVAAARFDAPGASSIERWELSGLALAWAKFGGAVCGVEYLGRFGRHTCHLPARENGRCDRHS